MKQENIIKPVNGYVMLLVELLIIWATVTAFGSEVYILGGIGGFVSLLVLGGFMVLNPNESAVLTLFGKYVGTVKENGFYFIIPFYSRKRISLKARNFDSDRVKVNDKIGNPIMISVILVWRVKETFKAAFEVDDYNQFVVVQCDAAVRKLAGLYPYDNIEDEDAPVTLRSGMNEVNHALEEELMERLEIAGIEVIEARIGYLAYAQEIAGAMLRRQQATAVVAARKKIVEGAVGMVEMALEELSKKEVVELDEEKKAAVVANLMVVLCSDREATPIVNAGTLNH
ncbi:MAG: SPFH domain-containing protein [Cytophagales bacterium]|nr:SPFH domain-containing protein [Cytophagales bacterium]